MASGHYNSNGSAKISYLSEEAATEAVKRRWVYGWRLRAYKCNRKDKPDHWHLKKKIPPIQTHWSERTGL